MQKKQARVSARCFETSDVLIVTAKTMRATVIVANAGNGPPLPTTLSSTLPVSRSLSLGQKAGGRLGGRNRCTLARRKAEQGMGGAVFGERQ